MREAGFGSIGASGRNGTIYLGVTSNLAKRLWEHRQGVVPGFTRDHGCSSLVWFEAHAEIGQARLREAQMKKWKRAWKLGEIEGANPDWDDLFETIAWN